MVDNDDESDDEKINVQDDEDDFEVSVCGRNWR
jgi:hypothetical protein